MTFQRSRNLSNDNQQYFPLGKKERDSSKIAPEKANWELAATPSTNSNNAQGQGN